MNLLVLHRLSYRRISEETRRTRKKTWPIASTQSASRSSIPPNKWRSIWLSVNTAARSRNALHISMRRLKFGKWSNWSKIMIQREFHDPAVIGQCRIWRLFRSMLLDQQDMQLMDWFFANLELRMATHLNNLSLRHGGCCGSNVESSGSEIFIKKGFHALTSALTKKHSIFQYNTIVRDIMYSNEGGVYELVPCMSRWALLYCHLWMRSNR